MREIRLIYRRYKKISDGCDGKCVGFGGSLSPKSLDQLFQAMNVFDCRFVDLGAGDGRVLVAVLVAGGAKSAVGYELPGNFAQKFIYSGVLSNLPRQVQGTADIVWKDIDEVYLLNPVDKIQCFHILLDDNSIFFRADAGSPEWF